MFAQIVLTKKPDGRTYKYLHIVESYRDGKTIKKRRIASLGNIDGYSEKDIEQIIHKLETLLKNRVLGTAFDIKPYELVDFGISYIIHFLWDELDLTGFIRNSLCDTNIDFDVSHYIKILVINRLSNIFGKFHLYDIIDNMYLPNSNNDLILANFYNTLGYLAEIKPKLELYLYSKQANLVKPSLSIVFCYFIDVCFTDNFNLIGDYGLFPPDQLTLKNFKFVLFLANNDIPIKHDLFSDKDLDSSYLDSAIKNLKHEYSIEQCVFVGDSKVIADDIIKQFVKINYPFIIGYDNNFRIVDYILMEKFKDVKTFNKIRSNLYYKEISVSEVDEDSVRYILCYDHIKALRDEALRLSLINETEFELTCVKNDLLNVQRSRKTELNEIMNKVNDILEKKGVASLFKVNFDGYDLDFNIDKIALSNEKLYDGKFLIKSNLALSAQEIVDRYDKLANINRKFREIKNCFDITPLFKINEKQINGYVFVCVLAYLFERRIIASYSRTVDEKNNHFQNIISKKVQLFECCYTDEQILDEIYNWKALRVEFIGKKFLSVTLPKPVVQEILDDIGMGIPLRVVCE